MCGIVGYFGGAGNSLTRLLAGMSAIIYRAPDSTGVGLFGDDREPIRLRKSLGSVVQLIDALRTEPVHPRPETFMNHILAPDADGEKRTRLQRRLLDFEGFNASPRESNQDAPDCDALLDLAAAPPVRLEPGAAGKALFRAQYRIRSRKELSRLIQTLVASFDLSPLVIHTMIREALDDAIPRRRDAGVISASRPEILAAFDDLFETTRAGARVKRLRRGAPRRLPRPPTDRDQLWRLLNDTVIRIPFDYNRDGVCYVFRLLDGALLSRLAGEPSLVEELDRVLDWTWPPPERSGESGWVDWRTLYAAEKALNVYGRAAAAALTWIREETSFPAEAAGVERPAPSATPADPPGRTDPRLLRWLVAPIMAHGRWAMQSAVTQENAHPFMDAGRRRALALNGQFDGRVEARLRAYLETVGGYRPRADNSSELVALLWGCYYDQLSAEQRRGETARREVREDLTDFAICGQIIDYRAHRLVHGRAPRDLDRMAFVAAARRICRRGGQIAVVGISLESPRRLYVASHNRPVFIVRRLENDDFMVVSDINAALGLFPQILVEKTIRSLESLRKRQAALVAKTVAGGAGRAALRTAASAFTREREELLAPFAVEVHPLDGEEMFALIETIIVEGAVRRSATISNFDGAPLLDVEPFNTRLYPETIRKDIDTSFLETHLREAPERFRIILDAYSPDADGEMAIDLKTRILRRRFGHNLAGLRRLILVGCGSAFHMADIARHFLAKLMPDVAIDAMRPGDIEDPGRSILTQRDLVVLLSWSSTTAEMVQLAIRLSDIDALMIGVTEKCHADMGLVAAKSVGAMPVRSGEEVTVAGIKSTLCMLLCVDLLGIWMCSERGMTESHVPVFNRVNNLADRIEFLNDDEEVVDFSRKTADAIARADAVVVVGPWEAAGVGREYALKIEEAGWFPVCKWRPYDDIFSVDPRGWAPGRFVIVHATWRARIDASVDVMEKIADAGVAFAVITCPNRRLDKMQTLSRGRCLALPWVDDHQAPLDLALCYRLALEVGFACGHAEGAAPRNRAKSVTVARSMPKALLSSAAELKRLAAASTPPAPSHPGDGRPAMSHWEEELDHPHAVETLGELRRLTESMGRPDPLAALGIHVEAGVGELGRLLFDARSEVNELVLASLDPGARGATRDAAVFWRRMLDLPIRELPGGEWPRGAADDALVLVTTAFGAGVGEAPLPAEEKTLAWIGPEPPPWLSVKKTPAGRFIPTTNRGRCSPARLYAVLNGLIARAWTRYAPRKASIVTRCFAGAAAALDAVLGDARLLAGIRVVAAANAGWRTAFFISPLAGCGRMWEEHFDARGRVMMVHHPPGCIAHGPIATIDGAAAEKYVALENRAEMAAQYGETRVTRWEARHLLDGSVDDFLTRSPSKPVYRPRAPFYADNRWRLPVLRPGYDTRRDNLIFLDMTSERDLPRMLDELSLVGGRAPRLVVITQEARIREAGEKALFSYPISDLLMLPSPNGAPIADPHLPFVLPALGAALSAAWPGKD